MVSKRTMIFVSLLLALSLLVAACDSVKPAPTKQPTAQRFDSSAFTTYVGLGGSIDATPGKSLTKAEIQSTLVTTCDAALRKFYSNTQGVSDIRDCNFSVVMKIGMNDGSVNCAGYNVGNDAVLALDKVDVSKIFSVAFGVYPIPMDAETIAKEVCPK